MKEKSLVHVNMNISRYDEIKMPKCFAPNPEESAKNIKELKYRDGDVLICAYPKCGNHWAETIIRCLLRKHEDDDFLSKPSNLEFHKPEFFESMPAPRVFFTHLWPKRMPREHVEKRGKTVLILRNPKDVIVAAYHHFTKETALEYTNNWGEHVEAFIKGEVFFGDMFEYLGKWHKAIEAKLFDIKYFYYEDLKLNPIETFRGIAEHIGVEMTTEELQTVIDKCSMANVKKMLASRGTPTKPEVQCHTRESILYRKGDIGDWKTHFTVTQAERLDEIIKEKLKDSMFKFRYE